MVYWNIFLQVLIKYRLWFIILEKFSINYNWGSYIKVVFFYNYYHKWIFSINYIFSFYYLLLFSLYYIFAIPKKLYVKETKGFNGRKIIRNHLQRLLLPKLLNLTKILGGWKNLPFVSNLDLLTSRDTQNYFKSLLEGPNMVVGVGWP